MEISKEVDAEVALVRSSGGVFEVYRDGELIFSKKRLGRFPEPGEIVDLLLD